MEAILSLFLSIWDAKFPKWASCQQAAQQLSSLNCNKLVVFCLFPIKTNRCIVRNTHFQGNSVSKVIVGKTEEEKGWGNPHSSELKFASARACILPTPHWPPASNSTTRCHWKHDRKPSTQFMCPNEAEADFIVCYTRKPYSQFWSIRKWYLILFSRAEESNDWAFPLKLRVCSRNFVVISWYLFRDFVLKGWRALPAYPQWF